jgi:hypothetical protein
MEENTTKGNHKKIERNNKGLKIYIFETTLN